MTWRKTCVECSCHVRHTWTIAPFFVVFRLWTPISRYRSGFGKRAESCSLRPLSRVCCPFPTRCCLFVSDDARCGVLHSIRQTPPASASACLRLHHLNAINYHKDLHSVTWHVWPSLGWPLQHNKCPIGRHVPLLCERNVLIFPNEENIISMFIVHTLVHTTTTYLELFIPYWEVCLLLLLFVCLFVLIEILHW